MKSSRLNYADWRTINQIEKINESTAHNTVFESMALQGLIIFLFLSAPLLKHKTLGARRFGQNRTMKQLTWKLILPLTVISFSVFTKWWYVLPVDAPDTMMIGFPFPYACDGWHTSLSLQIFFTELLIDLLTYFSFWFIVTISIERFFTKINLSKVVTILLLSTSGLCICGLTLFAINPDNIFYIKRPFDIEVLKTGYKFVWDGNTRPELRK